MQCWKNWWNPSCWKSRRGLVHVILACVWWPGHLHTTQQGRAWVLDDAGTGPTASSQVRNLSSHTPVDRPPTRCGGYVCMSGGISRESSSRSKTRSRSFDRKKHRVSFSSISYTSTAGSRGDDAQVSSGVEYCAPEPPLQEGVKIRRTRMWVELRSSQWLGHRLQAP